MEDGLKQIITQLHSTISDYKMPASAKELIGSGEVTILCGVTASGKNTIARVAINCMDWEDIWVQI